MLQVAVARAGTYVPHQARLGIYGVAEVRHLCATGSFWNPCFVAGRVEVLAVELLKLMGRVAQEDVVKVHAETVMEVALMHVHVPGSHKAGSILGETDVVRGSQGLLPDVPAHSEAGEGSLVQTLGVVQGDQSHRDPLDLIPRHHEVLRAPTVLSLDLQHVPAQRPYVVHPRPQHETCDPHEEHDGLRLTPGFTVGYLDGLEVLNADLDLLRHQGREDHLVDLQNSGQGHGIQDELRDRDRAAQPLHASIEQAHGDEEARQAHEAVDAKSAVGDRLEASAPFPLRSGPTRDLGHGLQGKDHESEFVEEVQTPEQDAHHAEQNAGLEVGRLELVLAEAEEGIDLVQHLHLRSRQNQRAIGSAHSGDEALVIQVHVLEVVRDGLAPRFRHLDLIPEGLAQKVIREEDEEEGDLHQAAAQPYCWLAGNEVPYIYIYIYNALFKGF